MALTTTCPHCNTTFRLVADQLKLRKGLVRCGVCQRVFSGEENLQRVQDSPPDEQRMPSAPSTASPMSPPATPSPTSSRTPIASPVAIEPVAIEPVAAEPVAAEPTQPEAVIRARGDRDAVTTESASTEFAANAQARAAQADLRQPPWDRSDWGLAKADQLARLQDHDSEPRLQIDAVAGPDQDAIDFFTPSRRARGFSSRAAAFAALASMILGLLLMLQVLIGSREWIAVRVPALMPVLSGLVAPLGLQVLPPRQLTALTIESFELQASNDESLFALSALLRNSSTHRIRWPAMELTLNAPSGGVLVRKVLMPADYLDAATSERNGIAPGAEQTLKLGLRATGIEASAYSVKLFYP